MKRPTLGAKNVQAMKAGVAGAKDAIFGSGTMGAGGTLLTALLLLPTLWDLLKTGGTALGMDWMDPELKAAKIQGQEAATQRDAMRRMGQDQINRESISNKALQLGNRFQADKEELGQMIGSRLQSTTDFSDTLLGGASANMRKQAERTLMLRDILPI